MFTSFRNLAGAAALGVAAAGCSKTQETAAPSLPPVPALNANESGQSREPAPAPVSPQAGIPSAFRVNAEERASLLKNVVVEDTLSPERIERCNEVVASALKVIKQYNSDLYNNLTRDGANILVVSDIRAVAAELGLDTKGMAGLHAITITPLVIRANDNPGKLAESQGNLIAISVRDCDEFAKIVGHLVHEGCHMTQPGNEPKGAKIHPRFLPTRPDAEVDAYTRSVTALKNIVGSWKEMHTKAPEDNLHIAITVMDREIPQHELYLQYYQGMQGRR